MSEKTELAKANFKGGYNCAQSVFLAFSDDFGFDKEQIARMVTALGGGCCKTKNMCGALSAAVLAMSTVQGKADPTQGARMQLTYKYGAEMIDAFKEKFGSANCPDLLGYDISDPDQFKAAVEAGAFAANCTKLVEEGARLAEEYMAKEQA